MKEKLTLQKRLNGFFESESLGLRYYWVVMSLLIVASLVLLAAEFGYLNPSKLGIGLTEVLELDFWLAIIFLGDYLVRFYAANGKLGFVKYGYNVVDLIAIVSSLAGAPNSEAFRSLRFFRMFKSFRIARLLKIIKLLEPSHPYEKNSEAYGEVAYYDNLLDLHQKLIDSAANEEEIQNLLAEFLVKTDEILLNTNRAIEEASINSRVDDKQTFHMSFYESTSQLRSVLDRFNFDSFDWNFKKLEYLIRELGTLINAEHTKEEVTQLESQAPSRGEAFLKLLHGSLYEISMTFTIALTINIMLKLTGIYESIAPDPNTLRTFEAAMGALIVFITSFNLSYTNSKRANTDIAVIEFTNCLAILAERLKTLVCLNEESDLKKKEILNQLNTLFGIAALEIVNGVKAGNGHSLKYDTAISQCVGRIRATVDPYLQQADEITANRIEETMGELTRTLNKFQIISTIRAAIVFSALNHYVIRITYFVLVVISPLSSLLRLFAVNLMQRAFFKTATETDNAILTSSLSKLPVEDRILRRSCKISGILCVDPVTSKTAT